MKLIPAEEMFASTEYYIDIGNTSYLDAERVKSERMRIDFELMAVEAARSGANEIVITESLVPISTLNQQGFAVRELIRKDALLRSLEAAAENAEHRAASAADRFVFANEYFHINDCDGFLHRNKLISLILTLWGNGVLNEESSIYAFESKLKSLTDIDDELILSNRFLLKSIFEDVKSMKMAIAQSELIKLDHALLPTGAESGYLVSWGDVELGGKLSNDFSPELLKWYSLYWVGLIEWLNESMRSSAAMGSHFLDFIVGRDDSGIYFYDPNYWDNEFRPEIILWQAFFGHLASMGYQLSARLTKYNSVVHDEEIDSFFVDSYCDFDVSECDILGVSVGWVGVPPKLARF